MSENSETAVVRAQDETPNDRNDRGMSEYPSFTFPLRADNTSTPRAQGIRKAASWYSSHISLIDPKIRGHHPKPKPVVLLLTDDIQNRVEAEKAGIKCSSGEVPPHRYERDGHFSSQEIRGEFGR